MNNGIKFKAWDNEHKRWSNIALNYRIADIGFCTDYTWCQCTGYKDSNGIDIFNHDNLRVTIVRANRDGETSIETYVTDVIFEDGCFCINGSEKDNRHNTFLFAYAEATHPLVQLEVIGSSLEQGVG